MQRELRTAYARYLAVTNAGAADVAPTVVGRGSTTQCRGNGQDDRRRDIDDTSNDCVALGYLAGEDRVIEAVVHYRRPLSWHAGAPDAAGLSWRPWPRAGTGRQTGFQRFWMLCGAVAPLVLTAFTDLPGVLLGVGAVTLFFLSLRRLNRQMVAVKRREPNLVLDLCMRAYQQVRDEPTSEVLQRQVSVLNAEEALEKRAESSVIP